MANSFRDSQSRIRPRRTSELWAGTPNDGLLVLSDAKLALDQYRLNAIGGSIWRLCDGERTISDIVGEIKTVYKGSCPDHDIIASDILRFLISLRRQRLVDWDEAEKLDILLVVPPAPTVYSREAVRTPEYSAPPLGLCYIAANLRMHNIRVAILDLHQRAGQPEDVISFCKIHKPDIVGITASTPSYPNAERVARFVKAWNAHCTTVLGGPHASSVPEECAISRHFDFVCIGEGEQALLDLSKALLRGDSDPKAVAGFCFLDSEGEIIRTPPRPRLIQLDMLPLPARELLELETYYQKGSIISSRGCPIGCNFCACAAISGRSYRVHSVDYVLNEMAHMIEKYHCHYFDFHDDVFNLRQDRVFRLCSALERLGVAVEWGCFCRAAQMSPALAKSMAEAGCRVIQYGVEAGNAAVLRSLKKETSLAQIEAAVRAAAQAGIEQIVCGFIIGHAADTPETINDTIKFGLHLRDLGATRLTLSLLTPYPGTEVYRRRKQLGIKLVSKNWEEYTFSRVVSETGHLCHEELRELYTSGLLRFLEATLR